MTTDGWFSHMRIQQCPLPREIIGFSGNTTGLSDLQNGPMRLVKRSAILYSITINTSGKERYSNNKFQMFALNILYVLPLSPRHFTVFSLGCKGQTSEHHQLFMVRCVSDLGDSKFVMMRCVPYKQPWKLRRWEDSVGTLRPVDGETHRLRDR